MVLKYFLFINAVIIFCRLFVETLNFSRWVHDFETLAYKINPDHIHLIFQPGKSSNYSEIMQTIKRNFSRDCNDLIFNRSFIRNLNSYRRRFESSPVLLQNSLNRELKQGFSGDKYDLVNIRFLEIFENHLLKLNSLRDEYHSKIRNTVFHFKWQKSFHVWIIENEIALFEKIDYIRHQSLHHKYDNNSFLFVSENYLN